MTEQQKAFQRLVSEFNNKINRIPVAIEEVNPNIDFSNGRHQEVMIDIENCCSTLAEDFYLVCEEIENTFK